MGGKEIQDGGFAPPLQVEIDLGDKRRRAAGTGGELEEGWGLCGLAKGSRAQDILKILGGLEFD